MLLGRVGFNITLTEVVVLSPAATLRHTWVQNEKLTERTSGECIEI